MGKYQDELRLDIQSGQKAHRDISNRALQEFETTGGFKRAPSLRDLSQGIRDNPTGFLPTGQRSNIAMMDYQGTPGQMYVNTPDVKPGTQWGTNLYPQRALVAAPPPIDTDLPEDTDQEEPLSEQLIAINDKMKGQGLPEFKTMQDFYDFVSDQMEGGPPILPPYMLANEGGLASLPVYMAKGGEGFANLGSHISSNMPNFRSGQGGLQFEGKGKDDLGQSGSDVGYNTVGTEEYESRQRPVATYNTRKKARQERRANRRQQRANNREAAAAAKAYGKSHSEPSILDKIIKARNFFPEQKAKATEAIVGKIPGISDTMEKNINTAISLIPGYGDPGRVVFQGAKDFFRGKRPLRNFLSERFGKGDGMNEGGIVGLHGFSNGGMSDLAMLSKEELIQMIMKGESRINPGQQFGQDLRGIGEGLGKLFGMGGGGGSMSSAIGSSPLEGFSPDAGTLALAADGGIMSLADGGYPRMNGQISGPGTERSDDIPAMLSDGEFVVNAKAVRGIGNINGANGDKEDQRREGARMMYALQQAGEEAARRT